MEGEGGFTRGIIDEIHPSDIQGGQVAGESGVLEVSLMNFILRISKEMKWMVKVVLLEVSLLNIILGISEEVKWKLNVVLVEALLMNFILSIWFNEICKWCYSRYH